MTRSHRRDTTMVALLFSIVIVFLTCHFSKLVLNIYEAAQVGMMTLPPFPNDKYDDNLVLIRPKLSLINISAQMVQYGTLLHWPTWADNLTRWNHLMLVINSSSNIIIYVAKVSVPTINNTC